MMWTRISKRVFQENKARQIFRKMNISYPLIRTRTRAYQGVRNICFSENLVGFVFLKHPSWDLPFCLITDELLFYWDIGTQNTELIVLKPLDYEAKQSFRLDVVAFDGKTFIKTKVTINVKNMNDNKLAASQPCFEANLPENVDYRGTLITVQGMRK